MDHSRVLPGGPGSSEGPTVATEVLSPSKISLGRFPTLPSNSQSSGKFPST